MPSVYPQWVKTIKQNGNPKVGDTIWHAEFYPFLNQSGSLAEEKEAIFAFTFQHSVVVAGLFPSGNSVKYKEICRFADEDDIQNQPDAAQEYREPSIFRIAWSVNDKGEPLLLVMGRTRLLRVYNVTQRALDRVLIGIGAELSEIRVPRSHPHLVFTAGGDREIRVWNLKNRQRECAAIFAGSGDQGTVHALDVHPTMRYFICGGADVSVNLWAIPETLDQFPRMPQSSNHREKIARVNHPHFQTTDIHGDPIDCLQWWGDLILSRACREHKIILWKIENFDSSEPALRYPAYVEAQVQKSRNVWRGTFHILYEFSYAPKSAWPGTMWNHFAFCPIFPRATGQIGSSATAGASSSTGKKSKKRKAEDDHEESGPLLVHGGSNGYIHVWNMKKLKLQDIASSVNDNTTSADQTGNPEGGSSTTASRSSRSGRSTRSKSASVPRSVGAQITALTASNAAQGDSMHPVMSTVKIPSDRRDVPVPDCRVCHLAFSPGGKFLVAAMEKGTLCVYMRPK